MTNSTISSILAKRQKKANLWKYVVGTVLDEDDDGVLNLTLKHHGIKYLHDVLGMRQEAIDNLTYIDPTESKEKKTPTHLLSKLHMIKAWNIHLQNTLQTAVVDWSDKSIINEDSFDEYRVSIYNPDASLGHSMQQNKQAASTKPTSTHTIQQNLASEFKKGIKRDKTHYSSLKDEKQWDEWKRRTIATIHAHGCENVVSPTYVPTTPDEMLLFK